MLPEDPADPKDPDPKDPDPDPDPEDSEVATNCCKGLTRLHAGTGTNGIAI